MSYCNWGNVSDVTQRYHDEKWGMPVRDDNKPFEMFLTVIICTTVLLGFTAFA